MILEACHAGKVDACRLLFLKEATFFAEADPQVKPSAQDLMFVACAAGRLKVMRWLFVEARALPSLRIRNENGSSLLWMACWKGHLDICHWLHGVADDAGGCSADSAVPNDYGQTPMLRASLSGHLEVCRWLFYDAGAVASVRTPDRDGRTPLGVACWQGHLDLAKWLASTGATPDALKRENGAAGKTVFFNACQGGHLEVAKWLAAPIQDGGCGCGRHVDVASSGMRGRTPLAAAVIKGHAELCCWLVVHGGANNNDSSGGGGGQHVHAPSLGRDVPSLNQRRELRVALGSHLVGGGGAGEERQHESERTAQWTPAHGALGGSGCGRR